MITKLNSGEYTYGLPSTIYASLAQRIRDYGYDYPERGCKELAMEQFYCSSTKTVWRRGMNVRLGLLEAAMFCGSFFDLDMIKEVAPSAKHELYEKQSDYGNRVDWPGLFSLLAADIHSRRAILSFNRNVHMLGLRDDLACTLNLQAHQRIVDGELYFDVDVFMRSWDMAFGLPMDMMMFGTAAQLINAWNGKLRPSSVNVCAANLHIYKSTDHLVEPVGSITYQWHLEDGLGYDEYQKFFANAASAIARNEPLDDIVTVIRHKEDWFCAPRKLEVSK